MNRSIALLSLLWLFAGCAESGTGEAPPSEPQPAAMASALEIGQRAYEDLCAGCHDEGVNGAPRTGVRADWENRSWLWEAVLFEHAREGFNEMPEKGGDSELDDATVTKAAEYMMSLTFPELPRG